MAGERSQVLDRRRQCPMAASGDHGQRLSPPFLHAPKHLQNLAEISRTKRSNLCAGASHSGRRRRTMTHENRYSQQLANRVCLLNQLTTSSTPSASCPGHGAEANRGHPPASVAAPMAACCGTWLKHNRVIALASIATASCSAAGHVRRFYSLLHLTVYERT